MVAEWSLKLGHCNQTCQKSFTGLSICCLICVVLLNKNNAKKAELCEFQGTPDLHKRRLNISRAEKL